MSNVTMSQRASNAFSPFRNGIRVRCLTPWMKICLVIIMATKTCPAECKTTWESGSYAAMAQYTGRLPPLARAKKHVILGDVMRFGVGHWMDIGAIDTQRAIMRHKEQIKEVGVAVTGNIAH